MDFRILVFGDPLFLYVMTRSISCAFLCLPPIFSMLCCSSLDTRAIRYPNSISKYAATDGAVLSNTRDVSSTKIICVLPPPAAAMNTTFKLEPSANWQPPQGSKVDLKVAIESSRTLAKVYELNERTLLLQFALYRLCEAYANGLIEEEMESVALAREANELNIELKTIEGMEAKEIKTKEELQSINDLIGMLDKSDIFKKNPGKSFIDILKNAQQFKTHLEAASSLRITLNSNIEQNIESLQAGDTNANKKKLEHLMSLRDDFEMNTYSPNLKLVDALRMVKGELERIEPAVARSMLRDEKNYADLIKQQKSHKDTLIDIQASKETRNQRKAAISITHKNIISRLDQFSQLEGDLLAQLGGPNLSAERQTEIIHRLRLLKRKDYWRGFDKVLATSVQLADLEKDMEKAKAEAEKAKAEADKVKAEVEKVKAEAEKAKADAEKAKADAEKAKAEAEKAKAEAAKPKTETEKK